MIIKKLKKKMKKSLTKVYKMGMNRKWNMKVFELHELEEANNQEEETQQEGPEGCRG